jgi:5-methylcytosine-specific restriction endonuclease McrA
MKACTKCGEERDEACFRMKTGTRYSQCRDCERRATREHQRTPEFKQRREIRLARTRERTREMERERYRKNLTKSKEKTRAYFRAHPEYNRHHVKLYRAKRLGNGGTHTIEEWAALKQRFGNRCLACGRTEPDIKLSADHVVPLSKGGGDDIANLQPLCRPCNSVKRTKIIDYRPSASNIV